MSTVETIVTERGAARPLEIQPYTPSAVPARAAAANLTAPSSITLAEAVDLLRSKRELLKAVLQHVPRDHFSDQGGKVYLDGSGSRMALQALGCRFRGKRVEQVTDDKGRHGMMATCEIEFPDGESEIFMGMRYIGDPDADADALKELPRRAKETFVLNMADAMQAAWQNLYHNAAADILGLKGLTTEGARAEFGIESGQSVSFDSGSRGGKGATGGAMRVPFGKDKDKTPDQLDKAGLKFHLDAAKRDLADPAKEKYHRKTQAWLDVLQAEVHRRQQVAAEQAGASVPPYDNAPPSSGPHGPDGERDPGADG